MPRKIRWLTAPIATVSALALVLAACGGNGDDSNSNPSPSGGDGEEAVPGGTLNMLGAGDVDYMDPNVSYYSIGYLGLRLWSRQLFTFPAEAENATEPAADLATEIPTMDNGGISADGLTYTIEIRAGAQWNTEPARQVTAEDLVRGVKRTCNPVQPFGGIPDFATLIVGYQDFCDGFAGVAPEPAAIADYINSTDLPGVVAVDERTVEFHLTAPATYFVAMLTLPAFSPAPEEVLQYLPGSTELGKNQVSDGPYQIDSYEPTKRITFSRNPAWDPETDPIRKAYVDSVVIDETVSQESVQQQLQTSTPSADMGWDAFPPPSQLPQLISSNDPNLNIGPTSATNPYIVFNTISPNENGALGKTEVRQALSYALNRDNLIQVLGGENINKPLTHVLPEGIVGSKDIDLYPHDPDQARDLLAQAGYPDGLTLKFLYRNESEGSRKAFETAQQDLSEIGVTVEGVASPNADFYTKYLQVPEVAERGEWDLSLAGWAPDWYGNAALSFFKPLFSGEPSFPPIGSNFGFYDNPVTNDLIDQAATATDEDQAAELWAQADEQVMEDAPFYPITEPLQANYHAEHLRNTVYIPAIQNFDPTNVWIEPDKQD